MNAPPAVRFSAAALALPPCRAFCGNCAPARAVLLPRAAARLSGSRMPPCSHPHFARVLPHRYTEYLLSIVPIYCYSDELTVPLTGLPSIPEYAFAVPLSKSVHFSSRRERIGVVQGDQWTPSGERLAIMYTITAVISNIIGDRITIQLFGWALAYDTGKSVWIDGVYPGACTASGKDLPSAMQDLSNTFGEILIDIASSSNNGFENFAREVNSFVGSTDEATLKDWESAKGDSEGQPDRVKITLEQVIFQQAQASIQPEPLLLNQHLLPSKPLEVDYQLLSQSAV